MKTKHAVRLVLALALILRLAISGFAKEENAPFFPTFADRHTVGLWLFDETEYPHTTLTDASENHHDLRLFEGGQLPPGRFGNALAVLGPDPAKRTDRLYARTIFPRTPGMAVGYADDPGRPPNDTRRLLTPNQTPEKLLITLKQRDWTFELWVRPDAHAADEAVLIDIGQGLEPGFTISWFGRGEGFLIENAYGGYRASLPAPATQLADGRWHHVAFVHNAAAKQLRLFVDGKPRGPAVAPSSIRAGELAGRTAAEPPTAWKEALQKRFNTTVGHDRCIRRHWVGLFDELRLSDVARYAGAFEPGTFSRNYGPTPPASAKPVGPRLLAQQGAAGGATVLALGSRKHLFIDEMLIDAKQDVQLTVNPPVNPQQLQPHLIQREIGGDLCVFDLDGQVCLVSPKSDAGLSEVYLSEDGVSFRKPELGLIPNGPQNYIPVPAFGSVFKDFNPNTGPEERYKLTATVENRGVYLYVSPDGIHWRRNETIMLPLVSGGGCESFWDDQRGVYVNFIKKDASNKTPEFPRGGRSASMFETAEIFKPWPFTRLAEPYFEGWAFPCPTGEGPVPIDKNEHGQVYRTRAIKYPWAPDVYLAFVWRLDKAMKRQTDLGISRDGQNWHFFGDKAWYLASGGSFADRPIVEALSFYGLIRRGDEIWQYAGYGDKPHNRGDVFVRLNQRLDGFVSLDAGAKTGQFTTKPLTFEGNTLVLNINAKHEARVGILNQQGRPFAGFSTSDCDPIRGDSVQRVVTWGGKSDLAGLAGKVIRLRVDLNGAKLYAFEFQ